MAIHSATAAETGKSDPIITRLASEDKTRWFRKPNLRLLYLMLFPTCMGIELTSGFDSQMINALQIVPYWKLYFGDAEGNINSSLKGIIAAAYSLGAILSLPFVPIINDKFGRRWSIFGGSAVMCLGAIIQGFAQHEAMYIIARMILGFGIPTCIVSGSSLIGELAYPKERAVLTSLFNVSYFIGSIVAAAICFGTNNIKSNWAWRIPSLLQICPSLLQMSFVLFLPESPRWLITKDRMEEAEAILIKYHAEGDTESEFVKAEMAQMHTTIGLELEASKRSWIDLFATSGMRRRLLITSFLGLFTQWSGNTLISYYLGDLLKMIGFEDSTYIQKINVSMSCWQLFCGVLVALLVLKNPHTDYILAYMVEVWPYAERSRGIAVFQLFGRLAGFFTTFVNPIGLDHAGWKYLISYCCWLAFEVCFVYFLFPETFGRTLEELAFIFEDKHLADQAVKAVEKVVHHEVVAVDGEGKASGDGGEVRKEVV
ncbi:putative mfs sugar protein [Phaeoacremonium minimum UCRPA7]|uniref:Putative mfs sugar protein n=1 Tax=Phaeoacremonium minimum (strain UCR-PA7) TaxID=1286976 RepID=R8BNG9_PHAM7|nr:putative mfs sugar protein [Phaeoacremonium minimum UCRPA7]EOO00948.1 putative mfs sugar protein [Phaeoacremonium minimum UCRPA7]